MESSEVKQWPDMLLRTSDADVLSVLIGRMDIGGRKERISQHDFPSGYLGRTTVFICMTEAQLDKLIEYTADLAKVLHAESLFRIYTELEKLKDARVD